MKRQSSVLLAAVFLAAGAAGCFDDPTSDLRNGAARLRLSRSLAYITQGDTLRVEGRIVDAQGNSLPGLISFSSLNTAVATASDVPADTILPKQYVSAGLIAGIAGGQTWVHAAGGGITDSLRVVVTPTEFTGTVSPATANVGDTITISASAAVTFDPSATTVLVDGNAAFVVSLTASQIKIIAGPAASSGVLTVENVLLLETIALPSLDASTAVTISDNTEPNNNSPATAAAMTLYSDKYGSLGGSDVDDFFRFTTTTADNVKFEIAWNNAADIDVYILNAAGTLSTCADDLAGCAMGTGANPEKATVTVAATTSYILYVNLYAGDGSNPSVYRIRTTKQ